MCPVETLEKNNVDHAECLRALMAVRDALDVVSGKWKLQIIIALSSGHTKFKDIERQIPKITPRMLSKELKDLEAHLLVKRTVYDTLPVTIEYQLTPHAKSLDRLIEELARWGMLHRKKVLGK
jgi:DNA-binding HxlR family transcriptional regulator